MQQNESCRRLGRVDSTAAIQAAAHAAMDNFNMSDRTQSEVLFPSGHYKISATINLTMPVPQSSGGPYSPGVTLRGIGVAEIQSTFAVHAFALLLKTDDALDQLKAPPFEQRRLRPMGPPGQGVAHKARAGCPVPIAATVNSTGLLSVKLLGATGDGLTDDSAAVQLAVRWAVGVCGGRVFFPSGTYMINKTIVLCDAEYGQGQFVSLVGEGDGKGPSSKLISYNETSPVFLLGGPYKYSLGAAYHFESLSIGGAVTGVAIVSTASAFFTNCDISARLNTGTVDNAALIVNNSFWIWFEQTDFEGPPPLGGSNSGNHSVPSVILRGAPTGPCSHDDTPCKEEDVTITYLVRFDRSVMTYGGVRYEQLTAAGGPPAGEFEFLSVTLESSDGPLLDIVSDPKMKHAAGFGFEQIVVRQFMDADSRYRMAGPPACAPVIRFNCSQPLCFLDGVTLESVSISGCFDRPNAAVQVVAGRVDSVLTLDSHKQGANDVLSWGTNHSDHSTWLPVGRWVSKSLGGWTIVGATQEQRCPDPYYGHNTTGSRCFTDATLTGYSERALLLGQAGDKFARLSLDTDGSICHGDGQKPTWDACHQGHVVHRQSWDPPMLAAHTATRLRVQVPRTGIEDLVQVSLSSLGANLAQLTGHVSEEGEVSVVLRNAGHEAMDVPDGRLKLLVSRVE